MLRKTLLILIMLGTASPAWAGWAEGMFDEFKCDFGACPRGQAQVHQFRVFNNTKNTVHIVNMRVTCGCTKPTALQYTLAPGQETAIIATMDTRVFLGLRTVDIFIRFEAQGMPGDEVKLAVIANSREELQYFPGSIECGKVKRGTTPTSQMSIYFYGVPQIQITDVKSESNYIRPAVQLVKRDNGQVIYQLSATVHPEIPEGKWFTDIWVTTNVATMDKLRIPLNIEVEPSGKVIVLPPVKSGEVSSRNVTLTGTQPFRILGIQGSDQEVNVREVSSGNDRVHVLSLTFRPAQVGQINRTIRVTTDMTNSKEIEFNAQTQSLP